MNTKSQQAQAHTVYQLRIELQHLEPLIWRRMLVPGAVKLHKLSRIMQAAMGWAGHHLHDWHIGPHRYGIPDEEWAGSDGMLDERKYTLTQVLGEVVNGFTYSYDFGDGWEHRIAVEERLLVQEGWNDWPMCLAGENACPPEDAGGPPGYLDFLQAMRDPKHEQHADCWRWWGGPLDPHAFSINAANMAIRKLR